MNPEWIPARPDKPPARLWIALVVLDNPTRNRLGLAMWVAVWISLVTFRARSLGAMPSLLDQLGSCALAGVIGLTASRVICTVVGLWLLGGAPAGEHAPPTEGTMARACLGVALVMPALALLFSQSATPWAPALTMTAWFIFVLTVMRCSMALGDHIRSMPPLNLESLLERSEDRSKIDLGRYRGVMIAGVLCAIATPMFQTLAGSPAGTYFWLGGLIALAATARSFDDVQKESSALRRRLKNLPAA